MKSLKATVLESATYTSYIDEFFQDAHNGFDMSDKSDREDFLYVLVSFCEQEGYEEELLRAWNKFHGKETDDLLPYSYMRKSGVWRKIADKYADTLLFTQYVSIFQDDPRVWTSFISEFEY